MHVARCWLGAALLGLFACANDDADEKFSDDFQPNELNASYGAFAEDGNLRIYAALLGSKGFVRLRGGDTIEVDVNGARMPTRERVLDDKVHYIVEMPAPPTDTEIAITFVRGVERVVGRIKLAGDFALKSPPATVKIGQSAEIDLDPQPDLSKWPGFFGPSLIAKAEVSGECVEAGTQGVPLCSVDSPPNACKQGYPTRFDASKLVLRPGSKGCELGVQVRLTSNPSPFEGTGPAKQSFKGGGFEGHRGRTFKLQLTE
jgi:hypothetical protein